MDGIKKVSYLPAKRMESSTPSMSYKGRIEIGSDADITIFNPETIIDKSTVKDTGAPSVGVEYVLVNGVIVKNKDGIVKGVKPEKPVMSYFVDKTIHNEAVEFKLKSNDGIDISIDNIYEIDGKTYLPIKEVFEELNILADIFKDDQINIGKILNLTIESKNANLRNQDIQLKDKLIIYKSDSYISLDDFSSLLNEDYEINQSKNTLELKTLEKKDKLKESFSNTNDKNK